MSFESEKKKVIAALGKPDKSKKGDVDEAAWPLINTINSLEDYYTTSSCAGRISVFKEPANGKKHEADWFMVSHEMVQPQELFRALSDLPQETLWLRMESPIFHIACRDTAAAHKLLKVFQANGWKRSGIISLQGKSRIMIELIGNERIDAPLSEHHTLHASEEYILFVIRKANARLTATRKKLEELEKKINLTFSEQLPRAPRSG